MGHPRGNCCVGNCCVGDSYGNCSGLKSNVQNCCVGNCCVGNVNVSAPTEPRIIDEISEAKTRIQERAKIPEQELVDYVNKSATEIKESLNPFTAEEYAGHKLTFDVENLDKLTKKFVNELNGFIASKVGKRLIPGDKEVVVILAEPDDTKRKENFDAFNERLFRNALKDLLTATETFYLSLADSLKQDVSSLKKFLTDAGKSVDKLDDVRAQVRNIVIEKQNYICDALKTQLDKSKELYPVKSIRLQDIAAQLDFAISGDEEIEIFSLKYAHEADENSLAIAYSEKDILRTKAQSVLTKPRLVAVQKTFMYCDFNEINAATIKVARLMIAEGIYPDYEKFFEQTARDNSMFGANVEVGEGTIIAPFVSVGENVKFGKNCKIDSGVFIGSGTQIGDGVKILSGSRVGVNCHYHYEVDGKQKSFCGVGRTIIKDGVEIGANTVIQRGTFSDTIIGAGTIIGNLVEIAHDVKIGADCLIVSQVGIAGNVTIGERVQIFGQVGIKDWVTIGEDAIILSKSGVTKNIRAGKKVSGMFAREHKDELKRLAKLKKIIEGE